MSVAVTSPGRRVVHSLPTLLVVALLAAVAYWGHRSQWRVPKFSEIMGNDEHHEAWCDEHGVPEDVCIECHADLVKPKPDFGWCPVHGVPSCPWEHPEASELDNPPTPTSERLAAIDRALKLSPRAENNPECKLHERRLQLASDDAMEKVGIKTAEVTHGPIVEAVAANGEIEYDGNHISQMSSRVAGTVARVFKQVGEHVTRGEIVALIDSADVGRAKATFLESQAQFRLARTNLERIRPLANSGNIPEKQYREAETADEQAHIRLLSARQALVNLGFVVDEAEFAPLSLEAASARLQRLGLPESGLDELGPTSNLFPIRAPIDGYVIQRKSVAGESIDTTSVLFTVADTSRMWLRIDIRADDIERITPGIRVRFTTEGSVPTTVEGPIAWINTEADPKTRAVKARIDLANADGKLRAHMFGTAQILLREDPQAVLVPNDAVHWEGCCHVVFVQDRNWSKPDGYKFFHVRKVRLGVKNDGHTEILAGLLPGEVVAAKGSVALLSQLLIGNLGADEGE